MLVAPFVFTTLAARFAVERGDTLLGRREDLWLAAWRMILDHPWTGVGIFNAPQAMVRYVEATRGVGQFESVAIHNPVLTIWAETGLPGLLLYMAVPVSATATFVHHGCRKRAATVSRLLRAIAASQRGITNRGSRAAASSTVRPPVVGFADAAVTLAGRRSDAVAGGGIRPREELVDMVNASVRLAIFVPAAGGAQLRDQAGGRFGRTRLPGGWCWRASGRSWRRRRTPCGLWTWRCAPWQSAARWIICGASDRRRCYRCCTPACAREQRLTGIPHRLVVSEHAIERSSCLCCRRAYAADSAWTRCYPGRCRCGRTWGVAADLVRLSPRRGCAIITHHIPAYA